MTELPTGTVTFLFTDIEGSTQLLQELGGRYRAVQDQHHAILRQAIKEAGGIELRTEGDSFFVVFRSASAAIKAVVAAQRGLARNDWPNGRSVRVRMGVHTGEGTPGGDEYIGIDVNRAARIAAAAWGGQVIFSEATKMLVEDSLPESVAVRSLGHHRLKDLHRAERLYDLVIPGLPRDFPAPRSLEPPSNLPSQLTSFVGRETQITEVIALLAGTRLLTLTGPGGTGKTRLALHVATKVRADFADGAFFVDLAPVADPALVVPAIAAALGVREDGWERPVRESLDDHLRDRQLLLLLDNFEQLIDAADLVPQLLSTAPALQVMVTSRAALHVRGEQVLPLTPLDVGDPAVRQSNSLGGMSEAVTLFAHRAVAVAPHFAVTEQNSAQVTELVARLDGLPLAIELAASKASVLTPQAMLLRLESRLPLLTDGPRDLPRRQQTLRATIQWSYDLLRRNEQTILRRLSVLPGGFTTGVATAVCQPDRTAGDDVLTALTVLADNSLAHPVDLDGDEPRFTMLQTVREFGLERLEVEDDRAAAELRRSAWFLRFVEDVEPKLRGPGLFDGLTSLQLEHENVRAVLRWVLESDEGEAGQRLVGAIWRFWHLAGHLSEGRRWASAVLALPSAARRTRARARALAASGGLAYWQHDGPAVRDAYEEALAICTEVGDDAGMAQGTYNLGFAYGLVATKERSRALFQHSREMFEQLGDPLGVASSLWALAMMARLEGDLNTAIRQADESVRLHRQLGDAFGLLDALGELGRAALGLGDVDVARASCLEMLEMLAPIGYRTGVAITLDSLAALENQVNHPDRALRLGGAAEALREAAGGQVPPEFADLPDPRQQARRSLSGERIAAAWSEGRAMTLQEAVAYAAEPASPSHSPS